MTTTTRFPSEPEPWLIPRIVQAWREGPYHICMARVVFPVGATVTLQALCGDWTYGILLHADIQEIVERYPGYGLCPDCEERWQLLPW